MGKKIPEKTVKLISAAAFIMFGFIGCYQVGAIMLGIALPMVFGILAAIAVVTGIAAYLLLKSDAEAQQIEVEKAA
jgi:hypothetical protein